MPLVILTLGFLLARTAASSPQTLHPGYGHHPVPGKVICIAGRDVSDIAVSVITEEIPQSANPAQCPEQPLCTLASVPPSMKSAVSTTLFSHPLPPSTTFSYQPASRSMLPTYLKSRSCIKGRILHRSWQSSIRVSSSDSVYGIFTRRWHVDALQQHDSLQELAEKESEPCLGVCTMKKARFPLGGDNSSGSISPTRLSRGSCRNYFLISQAPDQTISFLLDFVDCSPLIQSVYNSFVLFGVKSTDSVQPHGL